MGGMDLGNTDLFDSGGGGGFSLGSSFVSCSICLELVTDNGERSKVKLQCGHEFHLDCIGSAFNAKGVMQCPNCRKIDKGQWLYANGCRSSPEFSMDEWVYDEDLYEQSYSEMPVGVHWCPYSGLTRIPSTFESGPRAGSSLISSMVPPYPSNNSRAHDRVQALHAYPQQQQPPNSLSVHTPLFSNARRSGVPRGMPPVGPVAPPDHSNGFFVFPPLGSSGQNLQEAENPPLNRFYAWELDRFAPFPLVPVDRESSWWQPFHQTASGSDSSNRASGYWQRQGSERMPSQHWPDSSSFQPVHPSGRLHPFI